MSNPGFSEEPWNDIASDLRQAHRKFSMISDGQPIASEWESSPSGFDAFRLSMLPSGFDTDGSDTSLPDSPSQATYDEASFFIENQKQRNSKLLLESPKADEPHSLASFLTSFLTAKTEDMGESDVDWEFWGKLVSDYDQVAKKHPRTLQKKYIYLCLFYVRLVQGIPESLRGMVWQLMTGSPNKPLETVYAHLITRTSSYEKLIIRDLHRTFPKLEFFQQPENQESLFNVVKAYSLYDPGVGYCQGISFIVGPLLLNMPEEQSFCVLVRLMKIYEFRAMYTPQMWGLHMRLFQFDHLLEELFPAIHEHFEKEGVKSSMYASQWFLTLFAYRFPLDIVFRIYDMIMGVGIEAVFRFSFALLKRNQEAILTKDFESLLDFLKTGLYNVYTDGKMSQLLTDAADIKLSKSRVDKLKLDWEYDQIKQDPEYMSSDLLRRENSRLVEGMRGMETAYETLNQEHVTLANSFLELSITREKLDDEVEGLRATLGDYKGIIDDGMKCDGGDDGEIQRLAGKNVELVQRNVELEDRICELEGLLVEVRMRFAVNEGKRESRNFELGRR